MKLKPYMQSRLKKTIAAIVIGGGLVYASAFTFFDFAMHQSPEYFSGVMKHVGPVPFLLFPFETMWKSARQGYLKPGDIAPDFNLPVLNGSERVQLSSLRGSRPVVLVFGSYT